MLSRLSFFVIGKRYSAQEKEGSITHTGVDEKRRNLKKYRMQQCYFVYVYVRNGREKA